MYSDTANIIVGLDTSDIYEQINTIESYTFTIDSHAISKEYAEGLDGLQNRINNLKQLAKHLKALTHTRNTRGLLNIVGSVSKSLFGTLDDDDLTLINENMDKLFDDNNKIKTIIANQTALIRKILNSENLNHLEKSHNDILKQQRQANIDRFMLKMIMKLDTAMQTLHFQLDEILNVIILGKQGIISPQILDSDEFIKNYAKAIGSQMYNTAISAKTEHFQFILDISDLKLFTIDNKIFFKIIVPLVSNTEWNMLQVYPIPSKRNGVFLAPAVEHQMYLTSGLSFINADIEYFNKFCKNRAGTTICKQTLPIHDRNSRTDCRSEIINFKPRIEHCQITVFKIEDISFIPLKTSNCYIAIPANPIEIDTICQTKHTLQKLDKPSIIRANTSCDILYKDEHMRIGETKNEVEYEIKTKTLALKTNDSFTHLLDKLERAPKIIDNLQGYKTTIDKIGDEIETLNFEHRIKNIQYWGLTTLQILGYIALGILGIYGLNKIGVFKCIRKCIPNKLCINLFCCRNETIINSHNATTPPVSSTLATTPNIYIPTNTYDLEDEEEPAIIFKPRQVRFHKSLLKKT